MQTEKPFVVIATGISGVGKTKAINEFCKKNKIYRLDKDSLNRPFWIINPTTQGALMPLEQYIPDMTALGQAKPFIFYNGKQMFQVPFPSGKPEEKQLGEFYGRHGGLFPTYLSFVNTAKDNLELGISTAIDCFPVGRVNDNTLAGVMSGVNPIINLNEDKYHPKNLLNKVYSPNLRETPVILVHFYCRPMVLRERIMSRAEKDPVAKERNRGIVDFDKSFEEDALFTKHLTRQPLIWPEMQFYSHLQLDTSDRNPDELGNIIEQYVETRIKQHDELLYRVDENGKILGAVNYLIAHPSEISQKGVRHIAVNAFIFEDSDRKTLLVAQRNDKGTIGNSCGRHLVYGEMPLEGICDEAKEELFNGGDLPEAMRFTKVRTFAKVALAIFISETVSLLLG